MAHSLYSRRIHAILTGLVVTAASAACLAQHVARAAVDRIPTDPTCSQWVVNPVSGDDLLGTGTFAAPFMTLTHAMAVAAATSTPDTIILEPGEYSPASNGETWPVFVADNVSIQGTNALNTILRDHNTNTILVYSPASTTAFDNSVLDGVTVVGGRNLVSIVDGNVQGRAVRANPTFANCFFIDATFVAISMTNPVGMSGVAPFGPHDLNNNGFVEHRPKIINCTFRLNSVGIFNGRLPFNPASTTRAESEPGIVNALLAGNAFDMEGIDSFQVITSAFDTVNVRGSSIPIRSVLPIPVFRPASVPPLFIDNGQPVQTALDLRLLPFVAPGQQNPAIDTGSLALAWPNGTTGTTLFPCSIDIRDTDCEGYGNPRIDRVAIDIGADESGRLVITGYVRGTTDFTGPTGTNNLMTTWVNPFPPFPPQPYDATLFLALFPIPIVNPPFNVWIPWAPTSIDGARALTTSPPTPVPPFGAQLISTVTGPTLVFNYTSPDVPVVMPLPQIGPGSLLISTQAVPTQPPSTFQVLTNQQTFFLTP